MTFLKSEPVILMGEGEYNFNALKEIEITNSYLDLDEMIRGCQNLAGILECQTNHYNKQIQDECGCLPPHHMVVGVKVSNFSVYLNMQLRNI